MADYDYGSPESDTDSFLLVFLATQYIFLASIILVLISLHHLRVAISRRLWLFPSHRSRLFALNAGTLSLLSIASKPPNDSSSSYDEYTKLLGSVLMCTVLGACMPSMAADADLKELWSNVAGITLLGITVIVNICLQLSFHDKYIAYLRHEHEMVVIFLGMLLLVLWTQALGLEAMVSETRAMVSDHLHMIRPDMRPGCRVGIVQEKPWTWGAVEQESNIKVMMVLTSNPQNVVSRSATAAAVGILVVSSTLTLLHARYSIVGQYYLLTATSVLEIVQSATIFICTAISLLRWLQVAWHENKPTLSVFLEVEPSYWRRKLFKMRNALRSGNLKRRPNVLEEGQYGFKESLNYVSYFLLCVTIVPLNRMLVTVIRVSHMLSVLLMRVLVLPFRLLSRRVLPEKRAMPFEAMGIISLAEEDTATVHAHFVKAARLIIRKQSKRAKKKAPDTRGLAEFLKALTGRSASIFSVLDQSGALEMANLHVEYGYQYGWHLTLLSLLAILAKVENETLNRSQTMEACMDAFWQALDMVKVVDEEYLPIICSKETYLAACTLLWSELPKKKRRWLHKVENTARRHVQNPKFVLEALREVAKGHMKQFCETCNVAFFWPMQAIISYTMYTLCSNLCLWIDQKACLSNITNGFNNESYAEILVDHMGSIFRELLVGCLTNLPLAVSKCMTNAVCHGKIDIVERGIFVVGQGKQLWENLDWPTPCASIDRFGHLCQWFYPLESV